MITWGGTKGVLGDPGTLRERIEPYPEALDVLRGASSKSRGAQFCLRLQESSRVGAWVLSDFITL